MDNAAYQPPDLASVLQTLARFAPGTAAPANTVASDEPSNHLPHDARPIVRPPTPPGHRPASGPIIHSEAVGPSTAANIDPASITEWPAALRCVMKTVASHDASIARIQKLIQTQHEHEKQWWEGREALLKKQQARVQGREELNSVLRLVGGVVHDNVERQDSQDDVNELKRYDIKVHRASVSMVDAMQDELKRLGVPFFGLQDDSPIEKAELRRLQRKMLELLEDLCR